MNKKAKAKEKRGKTALVAGGLAALTALGLTVGSLFDSPSDLLQDDPATVLVSVQPDAAPDGGDGGDGDAETLDESERKRRGGVKATLREQILSVPLALRLLVVLPLWLLGSGVSIFATALWTAVSAAGESMVKRGSPAITCWPSSTRSSMRVPAVVMLMVLLSFALVRPLPSTLDVMEPTVAKSVRASFSASLGLKRWYPNQPPPPRSASTTSQTMSLLIFFFLAVERAFLTDDSGMTASAFGAA